MDQQTAPIVMTDFEKLSTSEKLKLALRISKFEGRLAEAETLYKNILSTPDLSNRDKLESYCALIQIAAEQKNIEKIPNYLDVLKAIPIQTNEEKSMYASCMFAVGSSWYYAGNIETARQYTENALNLARDAGATRTALISRLRLLELMRMEGLYKEVLASVDDLMAEAKAFGSPEFIAEVWILLGNVNRKQGNFLKAIECFESSREYFNNDKNGQAYHYILWALGTCYAALEDVEKARIYLELTQNSKNKVEFWRINILSKLTLAELYTTVGKFTEAEKLYGDIATAAGSDEISYYGRRAMRGKTLLAVKQGRFDEANELIDRLVIVAVREKKQKEIMRLRLLKAEVLLRTGEAAQHDEAHAMLEEALYFYKEKGILRHQAICLELLARLDSRSGFPQDALKKAQDILDITTGSALERLHLRALLATMVLERKLGRNVSDEAADAATASIRKLSAEAERVILLRFKADNYDQWIKELVKLNPHDQRYVNEFFEDFHFVQDQVMDLEIDKNSHYVREKHLGEIPFHNKFTLMRILLLLAESPGKQFSKEDLAREIWEQEYNPLRHDNNIYININRLRKLIEPNPRESRYVMNGSRGYYMNPSMKINISTKISDVAPRLVSPNNIGGTKPSGKDGLL